MTVWCEDGEKTQEVRVPAKRSLFHQPQASGHLSAPLATVYVSGAVPLFRLLGRNALAMRLFKIIILFI